MGAWDSLRNIVNYVRTRWRPTNPDSYHQYRAERERDRKQAEQTREHAERSSEREREGAERKREYEVRYTAERAAEEPRTPRRAMGRDEEAEMAKHQNLAEWQGKDLVDQDGHRIGKLEDVYVDVETDEPMFGTVKEGLFARHLTFVPLRGITIGPDNLQVPVSRDQVQDAPNIDMHGDELSQDGESALYHHYQLNYTPPNTESGRRLARR